MISHKSSGSSQVSTLAELQKGGRWLPSGGRFLWIRKLHFMQSYSCYCFLKIDSVYAFQQRGWYCSLVEYQPRFSLCLIIDISKCCSVLVKNFAVWRSASCSGFCYYIRFIFLSGQYCYCFSFFLHVTVLSCWIIAFSVDTQRISRAVLRSTFKGMGFDWHHWISVSYFINFISNNVCI